MRRRPLLRLAALSPLLLIAEAHAGTYLNSTVLLIASATHDSGYLRARLNDRGLAKLVWAVTSARLDAASRMHVPKEVVQAHPHLLLMLENYERAADAAAEGHPERFLIYEARARNEEVILRGVLKQLGFPLPTPGKQG